MKMYKIGDIVVIEEVRTPSMYSKDNLEGSIIQLTADQSLKGGIDFLPLYNASKRYIPYYIKSMKVRKIDQPLKFRGGKVINVEEATSPF